MVLVLMSQFVSYLKTDPHVDPTHSNKAFEQAATIGHCSHLTMRNIWKEYEQHGTIQSQKKRGRKRLGADIFYEGENLRTEHIVQIEADIAKLKKETGTGVTLRKLRVSLRKKNSIWLYEMIYCEKSCSALGTKDKKMRITYP